MRQFFFVLPLILVTLQASGASIVVLKSGDSPFHRKVFSGFSSAATEKVTGFRFDTNNSAALMAQVKKMAPDLILTIGSVPVRTIAEALPNTPLLVNQPMGDAPSKPNILFLDEDQPIRYALTVTQNLFPNRKTVGTVYNPKLSQAAFDSLVKEAAKLNIRLASLKVDTASDAKTLISALSGKIDFFLWLRDTTTSDPTVIKAIEEFSAQNNVPVISSDPTHVRSGALLSVAYDPLDLGEQAWEVAKVILKDKKIPSNAGEKIEKAYTISLSLKTAAQYGIGSDALYAFFQKMLKSGSKIELLP